MNRAERNWSNRNCRERKLSVRVTVVMLAVVIGCIFFAYASFGSAAHETTSTQQLIFVFRHGDRTPTETYLKDPHRNYDWPGGWGALTKKGMLELYIVGQWIRKEYGSVISDKYESSESLMQSSYAERCQMSGQALLAGLYPPKPEDMFVPGLAWRPIPVHYVPRNLDKVIVVKAPCPRLEEALKEAYKNESLRSGKYLAKYYEELTTHTGQNISTITDVEFLYNTLEIEEQNGLQLPDWTKEFYNQEMRDIAARSLAIFTSNTLQKRLRGGPLLKEIMGRMQASVSGLDKRQVYLYSAHDITLVNLLRTMGFTNDLWKPDYGATLVFELRKVDSGEDREIKVVYLNNTETSVAYSMKIPGCGTPCLLENLMQLWKDVLPNDWDSECRV